MSLRYELNEEDKTIFIRFSEMDYEEGGEETFIINFGTDIMTGRWEHLVIMVSYI